QHSSNTITTIYSSPNTSYQTSSRKRSLHSFPTRRSSDLSKMIKTLENSVGDALIVRQSKPFKLTAIGEHLYSKGQHILQAITELEHDVHAMQGLKMDRLRIGIHPMVNLLLTQTLKQFHHR